MFPLYGKLPSCGFCLVSFLLHTKYKITATMTTNTIAAPTINAIISSKSERQYFTIISVLNDNSNFVNNTSTNLPQLFFKLFIL